MAKDRIALHEVLCEILGSRNVYFQPPESIKMKYPAIVYSKSNIRDTYADNSVYTRMNVYEITVIDGDPDSKLVEKIDELQLCQFNRSFTSDNLNHYVFTIYY
jgi:hypothetical protein